MSPALSTCLQLRRLRQVESTVAMQALQPRIKEIQERYKGKPQDEMQVRCMRVRPTFCSLPGCLFKPPCHEMGV